MSQPGSACIQRSGTVTETSGAECGNGIVGDGIADQFKHYLHYQYEPEDLRDPGNWCDWVFICICDCDVCAY